MLDNIEEWQVQANNAVLGGLLLYGVFNQDPDPWSIIDVVSMPRPNLRERGLVATLRFAFPI